MTVSETHPRQTSQHSVILCYGYVLLFMLKILGTIKCAHAPFLSFFFLSLPPFYSSTNAQACTIAHTSTRTQHRHDIHAM